jgi:hypothetical protein
MVRYILLLITLPVIFLLISCGRRYKNFYDAEYPQIGFTLSVPNELHVQEMYDGRNKEGQVYRRLDSTGITDKVKATEGTDKDSNAVNEKRVIAEPDYFVSMLERDGWNLSFSAMFSGKYQDTAVRYNIDSMRSEDFLVMYVFGPGRDSAFYAGLNVSEITKDGMKLFKLVDAEQSNITYTGMTGKYWFMLQFFVHGKDTVWVRQIWDQSRFAN